MRAALGLRVHSGWAAAVLVAGSLEEPVVLDRRRLILADEEALEGSKQPFHAAEGHPLDEAKGMISRYASDCRRRATDGLREALRSAEEAGHRVAACGLLVASGRSLPDIAGILASHALIHAADGVHFRDALASAAGSLSLKVVAVAEREVETRAAKEAALSAEEVKGRIGGLGKALGPPWTQDQKLASLAGLVALATR